MHGSSGDGCWDSSVCPSRRSHARHRDRRNQTRNRKRRLEQDTVILTDSVAISVQEPINASSGIPKQLQFKTELPVVVESAVLQVYRQSVDAPVHAVGGEIWLGAQKSVDITPIHCMKLTPKQVEVYLERLLKKLAEVYGIRKFASIEELNPSCCPLPGCRGKS